MLGIKTAFGAEEGHRAIFVHSRTRVLVLSVVSMGNDQGIFRDSLERNTKRILKDALLSGKTILLREGIMKVTDEHTKESMKSKKDSKHGISGQAELMNILLNYLSEEFKITHIDSTEIVAASVMEAGEN